MPTIVLIAGGESAQHSSRVLLAVFAMQSHWAQQQAVICKNDNLRILGGLDKSS